MIKTCLRFSKQGISYPAKLLLTWLILIVPLIDTKIIPGHDYIFHVTRILDVAEAMKAGIFPVRMYVDEIQFWGTPVGIFYPGLFVYIPALLKVAGFPIEVCYNIFIALIFFFGIFSSWYGFSILTRSQKTGFYSAILYISSGWYLIDAYIRNALGELAGLSFMPLAIACIIKYITKPQIQVKYYLLGILSISAIFQSHLLSSVFLVIFCLSCFVILYRNVSLRIIKRFVSFSIILFLINASFLVPFFSYYFSVPLSIDFVETFSQKGWSINLLLYILLLYNFWIFIILSFFLLKSFYVFKEVCFLNHKSLVTNTLLYYNKFFLTGIFFTCLTLKVIPWDNLFLLKNIFEIIQFPWRFFGIATLFICVCGGYGMRLFIKKAKLKKFSVVSLIVLVCATNIIVVTYINPVQFQRMTQRIYWQRELSSTDDDYLYKGMDTKTLFSINNQYITDIEISNWRKELTSISFSYSCQKNSKIILPLVNYPGYIATDQNGKDVRIGENNNHMMVLYLPKGSGSVNVSYKGLFLFKISDIISLVSVLFFLFYSLNIYKRKEWNKVI